MIRRGRCQQECGYTILEVLFVTSILTFLTCTVFFGVMWRTQRAASDFEESSAGSIRATFAIRRISSDIRKGVPTPSLDNSSLELRIPDGSYVDYSLEEDELIRRSGNMQNEKAFAVLRGVTAFVAERDSSNPALVSITIATSQNRRIGRDLKRTYPFRVLSRVGSLSD